MESGQKPPLALNASRSNLLMGKPFSIQSFNSFHCFEKKKRRKKKKKKNKKREKKEEKIRVQEKNKRE